MEKLRLAILFSALLLLVSCTKKADVGQVTFSLPNSGLGQSAVTYTKTESALGSWNQALDPVTTADVNCFAVFVGGSGINGNSCTLTDGTSFEFGPNVGFAAAGTNITLTVPAGAARRFLVIGLRAQSLACRNFQDQSIDKENLSRPFVVVDKQFDVKPGANEFAATAQLDTTKIIADCSFVTDGTAPTPSPIPTPTIATGTGPSAITISADGTSVYVANFSSNTVSLYSRNTTTGALTEL